MEKNPPTQATENKLPKKITREDIEKQRDSKQGKAMQWIRSILYIIASSFLVSFAAYCLITPNKFTIGGASGIAILLNVISEGAIKQSVVSMCINIPLVALSYFFVKKRFAMLTTIHILLQAIWLALFENVLPDFAIVFADNGEKIFAAIAAGLCIGVSIALAFKAGGSTGGADIVVVMIQKKFAATSIAWMLFTLNCIVIGSSIFVFQGETPAATLLPIMMSIFESYIESKTNDSLMNGFQSAIEFRIITTKPQEMSEALMHELSRGVTALPATGMYTQEERAMLLCVISRRQIAALKRIMRSVDPDSFAVMANVSQVLGLGFHSAD